MEEDPDVAALDPGGQVDHGGDDVDRLGGRRPEVGAAAGDVSGLEEVQSRGGQIGVMSAYCNVFEWNHNKSRLVLRTPLSGFYQSPP